MAVPQTQNLKIVLYCHFDQVTFVTLFVCFHFKTPSKSSNGALAAQQWGHSMGPFLLLASTKTVPGYCVVLPVGRLVTSCSFNLIKSLSHAQKLNWCISNIGHIFTLWDMLHVGPIIVGIWRITKDVSKLKPLGLPPLQKKTIGGSRGRGPSAAKMWPIKSNFTKCCIIYKAVLFYCKW